MNKLIKSLLVLLSIQSSFAQLPPNFGSEYKDKSHRSEMVRDYLTPQKIVWQTENSEKYIKNVNALLKKGNGQLGVADKEFCILTGTADYKSGIVLDYGKEIHGGIKISMGMRKDHAPVKLRVRFGESVSEAMSDIGGKHNATNEHSIRDFTIEVPWLGSVEVGNSGFRFVRIDMLEADGEIPIKSIEAIFVYRDLPYLGSFESNDKRLNEIWLTGAYTVQLNMQDYLWDGIKRDRLVWVGDMHPEVMTVNAVFGNSDIVTKSLDLARDQYPLPEWMNGISSYSMWWLLIQNSLYNHHGDLTYLKEQETYMIGLLDLLETFIDKDNKEILNGMRFMDWPTSEKPEAIHAGLQAMMILTFDAGSKMMIDLGRPDLAKKYASTAKRLGKHKPKGNTTKQAAALMSLAGLQDPKDVNKVLKKDGVQNMSTFYGYYMLEAMAKANDYAGAMDVIREYWGGMLDLGATTFWEDFNINEAKNSGRIDEVTPEGKDDIHCDFGAYCYIGLRHSLCHGWASGPTPWLSQYVLGVQILDGGNSVKIEPHLGDLKWAKGSVPTNFGVLKVSHKKQADGTVKTEMDIPKGLKVIK